MNYLKEIFTVILRPLRPWRRICGRYCKLGCGPAALGPSWLNLLLLFWLRLCRARRSGNRSLRVRIAAGLTGQWRADLPNPIHSHGCRGPEMTALKLKPGR